jgi:hypothetical protein
VKTYHDAEGREYYLKEGEIHYLDEDEGEPLPSSPRNKLFIAIGAAVVLLIAGIGITQIASRPATVIPATVDLSTQVALGVQQTQTAMAYMVLNSITPTWAPVEFASTPPIVGGSETLTVLFSNDYKTCTEHVYTGLVNLDVSGSGQAGAGDWSDAFYLYQAQDGTLFDPPKLEQFDLEIDGNRAIKTLGLLNNPPVFNADHHYQVSYTIAGLPRYICFRISDTAVMDNSGEFQITVSGT